MAEARKTFPISVFNAYLKGENKDALKSNVAELLGFMTKKDVDDEFAPFACALSKAFIYEQHPELARMKAGEVLNIGDSVSVMELPAGLQGEVDAIFAKLADYRATIASQKAKIAELESSLADVSAKLKASDASYKEYKAKADKLEAGAKDEGEKVIVAAEQSVTSLNEKLADLASQVDKAKSSIIAILKAAPSAGGAGGAGGEAAAGSDEPGRDEPSEDFGFGSDMFTKDGW